MHAIFYMLCAIILLLLLFLSGLTFHHQSSSSSCSVCQTVLLVISHKDLISGLSQLDLLGGRLVPNKQVAVGAVCPRSQHLRSYLLTPAQLPGVTLKDDPAWKTEKTSATLNCVRGSDRYHCPEGCS